MALAKRTVQRRCDACGFRNEVEVPALLEGSSCRGCRARLRPLARPLPVDGASLQAIVRHTRLPVLVEVQIKGSNEEREQAPALERVAERLEGKLIVIKLDADEERELCLRLGITSVPAFVVFLGGEIVHTWEGPADSALLEEWIWQVTRG